MLLGVGISVLELRRVLWIWGKNSRRADATEEGLLGGVGEWRRRRRRRRERERGWHIFVWSSLARACHPPTRSSPESAGLGTSAKQGRWEQKQAVPADLGWIGERPTRGLLARGPWVDYIVIMDKVGARGACRAGEARRHAPMRVQVSA